MSYFTAITLRYPNGRLHEGTISTAQPLGPGASFELYGHTWAVVAVSLPHSRYDRKRVSLVCERADAAVEAAA